MKTKLSVNINKVALIRNSRGGNLPDLLQFAQDCESYGADGITVHPRPDERHIRYDDIPKLKDVVQTELNIEGYPSERFMHMVLENQPHQCTLVPDPPGVLTSNEGWKIEENKNLLKEVIHNLSKAGIRSSLFINADPDQVKAAKDIGADRVEIYTGEYAHQYLIDPKEAIQAHIVTAEEAQRCGIGLNAGHDLNLKNLKYYSEQLFGLKEVSIGHALISDALYYGIANVIGMYKVLL